MDESNDQLRQMVAEGRLAPPARPPPARAPRLALGSQSATELVLAEREADR